MVLCVLSWSTKAAQRSLLAVAAPAVALHGAWHMHADSCAMLLACLHESNADVPSMRGHNRTMKWYVFCKPNLETIQLPCDTLVLHACALVQLYLVPPSDVLHIIPEPRRCLASAIALRNVIEVLRWQRV